MRNILALIVASLMLNLPARAADPFVVYEGGDGPGKGKHVVFVTGDEEYRSEDMCPQFAKILSKYHGFKCTVLFAINKQTGENEPTVLDNIPGLEALDSADLMVVMARFRNLPDEQMKHIDDYLKSGKPVIGIRTATHAFNNPKSTYAQYSHNSKVAGWEGGFGRRVLGETWINHHGKHKSQSERGVVAPGQEKNPIVRSCQDIWGPSDVYTVRLPQPEGCVPVIMGQVLEGMNPTDKPVTDVKNNPMMPIAWTRTYDIGGKTGKVFTSTMGCAQDFESEGFRRLLVNATYWAVGLEEKIPEKAKVDIIGEYKTLPMGFGTFKKGVKPADHQ